MTTFVFANNVNTGLASAISTGSVSITLESSANLPSSIPVGSYFVLTLNDQATRNNYEIVYATAITGSTLTVLRAQEGTAALSWLVGDYVYSGPTAGQMQSFVGGNYLPLAAGSSFPLTDQLTISPASVNAVQILDSPTAGTTYAGTLGRTAGVSRWLQKLGDESAQSGANAGANYTLTSYTDAGAVLHTVLSINRATSAGTYAGAWTCQALSATSGSFSADVTIGGTVTSTGVANFNTSDRRLKTNIRVVAPRPIHRYVPFVAYDRTDIKASGRGPLAQTAQKFDPAFVSEYVVDPAAKRKVKRLAVNLLGIAYEQAMWASNEIDRQAKIIAALENRIAKLEAK